MRIFCTPRNGENGSFLARALLSFAYFETYGENVPLLCKTSDGKPFFPENSGVYLSLSHTDNFVLCALGEYNVGADIQFIRHVKPGVAGRVCAPSELEQFDFFQLWALKESFIKLRGRAPGSYKDIVFSLENGVIRCSFPCVYSRLYGAVESCSIAVCSSFDSFPENIEIIPKKNLNFST